MKYLAWLDINYDLANKLDQQGRKQRDAAWQEEAEAKSRRRRRRRKPPANDRSPMWPPSPARSRSWPTMSTSSKTASTTAPPSPSLFDTLPDVLGFKTEPKEDGDTSTYYNEWDKWKRRSF